MTAQRNRDATEAAVRWHRRLVEEQDCELQAEDFAEWEAWSAQPENLETFRAVCRVWDACSAPSMRMALPTDAEIAADEYDGSVSMAEWRSKRGQNERGFSSRRGGFHPDRFLHSPKVLVLAACLLTAAVTLALYGELIWGKLFGYSHTYITTSTQRDTVTLLDGSVLTLAPNTKVTAHYTASRRDLLLEKGEAWFKVAHDGARPFSVAAGTGVIVALGTQFDVRRERDSLEADRVTVAVGYGSVEVRPPSEGSVWTAGGGGRGAKSREWTPTRLAQGQEVTYDSTGLRGTVRQADLEAIAGWKQVKAEYEQTPLKTVIEQVNRYSDKPVVLSDPDGTLGSLPFSGTVFEFQLAGWLEALQVTYPVEVIELPDRVVIRSRNYQVLH